MRKGGGARHAGQTKGVDDQRARSHIAYNHRNSDFFKEDIDTHSDAQSSDGDDKEVYGSAFDKNLMSLFYRNNVQF